MKDEDFYIEETSSLKVFLVSLLVLLILGIFGGLYYFYFHNENIKLKNITIELGQKVPNDVNFYIKGNNTYNYELNLNNIAVDKQGNTNSVGEYSYTIKTNKETKKGKIYVKDTTFPIVQLRELTIGLNEVFEIDDYVVSCEDLSLVCNVEYVNEDDYDLNKKEGEYIVDLKISDKYHNSVKKKTKLIVSQNASLSEMKAKDNEVSKIYPVDENWNKTFTIKFEKGISENDVSFEQKILEITNFDFSILSEDKIKNQTILTVYNKYNYVLGFSVKIEYDNNKTIYVTQDEYNILKNN